MSVSELEEGLGFNLPSQFRAFLAAHPSGYVPTKQYFITETVGDRVESIYSTEDLLEGWRNTCDEPFMKDDQTLIIACLLGSATFTVGIGEKNADVIYYLDWHEGLTPIHADIHELLSSLTDTRL